MVDGNDDNPNPAPSFGDRRGWIHLLTNHGTLNLGNTPYAQAIWRATTEVSESHAASEAKPEGDSVLVAQRGGVLG